MSNWEAWKIAFIDHVNPRTPKNIKTKKARYDYHLAELPFDTERALDFKAGWEAAHFHIANEVEGMINHSIEN